MADGLVFPDRTPSPGLAEFKKVVEPVVLAVDPAARTVTVRNTQDFADTGSLVFAWRVEDEGRPVAEGDLAVPVVPAGGEPATVGWPAALTAAADTEPAGERHVTVTGRLAEDQPWAPAGHEVAWAQARLHRPAPRPTPPTAPPAAAGNRITLGGAVFDAATGRLLRIGDLPLEDLRVGLWRAPTDNDLGGGDGCEAAGWRAAGLDRLEHKLLAVGTDRRGLTVSTRIAAAGSDAAILADYAWSAPADGSGRVLLTVAVAPVGAWRTTWPRVGLDIVVPMAAATLTWYGGGPGEAYPDTRAAARIGRFREPVENLQTPYLFPQENGGRTDVRWARVDEEHGGRWLRISADEPYALAVRPWPARSLDLARHTTDLRPDGRLHLSVDAARHGIGSASCGPGVRPEYRLVPAPSTFAVAFETG
ncbi:beta-galactosidase small subunit family protein [Actinacidiphila sp. DG2A-62]|uniref:beta-galactosidase small subunit family protein n=1 Tax=Actinacidiphila sp. DG2A-62 TaxID=3108821 RepID=UPI003FA365FC